VSNLLPVFISKTLILREIQIKRALTSLFGIMSATKHPLYIGDNAHGHYTLSTAVMSSALSAELLADQIYLQIYSTQTVGIRRFPGL
jgi:hypothetical protein